MRALVSAFALFWAATSQAQEVPNGGFESGDLTDWTDLSSNVCAGGWCEDGEAFALGQADAGFAMPAGLWALGLWTGDSADWAPSFGAAESSPFLVTRSVLSWEMGSDATGLEVTATAFDTAGTEIASVQPVPVVDAYERVEVDVSAACATNIQVRVSASPTQPVGAWEPAVGLVVVDAFALDGAPCPMFDDADADGSCLNGNDIDGDGNCADPGEQTLDVVDCDDQDDSIGPHATDIPDNGVDEDCDGADAVSGGTGTGTGTATGGTSTGGTNGTGGGGTGTGGSSTGGGLTPTETDGSTEEGDPGSDEAIRASGAGCACSTGSTGTGWFAVGLAGLLVRRRR